ncbi:MAG: hypothetical protein ABIR03_00580 [Ginsengibacter sp.]
MAALEFVTKIEDSQILGLATIQSALKINKGKVRRVDVLMEDNDA